MENIKLSPSKLNRYPIDIRMLDISGKTSVSVSFTEKTVDIKIDEKACVLPKANFFNKHYEELNKIHALGYPKLNFHCMMDNMLKDNKLYVYDVYCNDNFLSYQDIEKLFAKADDVFFCLASIELLHVVSKDFGCSCLLDIC